MTPLYTGKGDAGTTGLLFGGRGAQGAAPPPGGRRRGARRRPGGPVRGAVAVRRARADAARRPARPGPHGGAARRARGGGGDGAGFAGSAVPQPPVVAPVGAGPLGRGGAPAQPRRRDREVSKGPTRRAQPVLRAASSLLLMSIHLDLSRTLPTGDGSPDEEAASIDAVGIGVFADRLEAGEVPESLDHRFLEGQGFTGEPGQTCVAPGPAGRVVVAIGLGPQGDA